MIIGCSLAFLMVFSRQARQLYILWWLADVGGRIAYSVVAFHHLYFSKLVLNNVWLIFQFFNNKYIIFIDF